MASIKQACKELLPLVEKEDHKHWPVLHVPLHANTFPLAYVYSCVLLIRAHQLPVASAPSWAKAVKPIPATTPEKIEEIKKLPLIKSKIRTEEWTDKPPELDRSASFNIFFANDKQIDLWHTRLGFQYFPIFNYMHKFFLVEDSTTLTYKTVRDWVQNLTGSLDQLRIVTDIEAEAGRLRAAIHLAFAELNKRPPAVEIARAFERSPHDVFQWTFVDDGAKKIARVFFFGTPLCQILQAKKDRANKDRYKTVTYDKEVVPTYLCIHASNPAEAYYPVWPFYKFFEELGYPLGGTPTLVDLNTVADAFRRCMETRLPGLNEQDFETHFSKSIETHCSLVERGNVFKER